MTILRLGSLTLNSPSDSVSDPSTIMLRGTTALEISSETGRTAGRSGIGSGLGGGLGDGVRILRRLGRDGTIGERGGDIDGARGGGATMSPLIADGIAFIRYARNSSTVNTSGV